MGPINRNFTSWWATHMLIIEQPDKPLRDLRNSKGSTELSATSMVILVSGVDQKCFWTLCLHTAHQSTWPRYQIQQCQWFIPPQPYFLQRQPSHICLYYHCWISLQAVSTFTNLVLYHMWVCSIILKQTLYFFFLQSGHINWYMQHQSLAQGEPLLYGEI